MTVSQLRDQLDRVVVQPRSKDIQAALVGDTPNVEYANSLLAEAQKEADSLLSQAVLSSQVSSKDAGKKAVKDALEIAKMVKDLALIVAKLAMTSGADIFSWINLVKLIIKLALFIKDLLTSLSDRIVALSKTMLKIHARIQNDIKKHWIIGELVGMAGLGALLERSKMQRHS